MDNVTGVAPTDLMLEINHEILKERLRQNKKWGTQRHPHELWHVIASEETGEAAQAILTMRGMGKTTDAQHLLTEVIQASAVYAAWAEQILEEMEAKAYAWAEQQLEHTLDELEARDDT